MKNVILLISLFFCAFFTFAQQSDSSVVFTENIKWSLFQGIPNSDTLGARISTSIYLEVAKVNIWSGTISFKACATMNPHNSWVKIGYADQYTLQHEQTHFNIAEICARGLQNELNLLKIKSRKSLMIGAIFAKWQNKLENLQRQYDSETRGGNDTEAQKTWNENVSVALKWPCEDLTSQRGFHLMN